MRYGNHTMDYNGCEIIAMYNALQKIGNPQKLNDVANWGEHNALWVNGTWGTKHEKIPAYFKKLGYTTTTENFIAKYDKALENADAAILTFQNNRNNNLNGIHTVYVQKQNNGSVRVYNFETHKTTFDEFNSIYEMIRTNHFGKSTLYCIHK